MKSWGFPHMCKWWIPGHFSLQPRGLGRRLQIGMQTLNAISWESLYGSPPLIMLWLTSCGYIPNPKPRSCNSWKLTWVHMAAISCKNSGHIQALVGLNGVTGLQWFSHNNDSQSMCNIKCSKPTCPHAHVSINCQSKLTLYGSGSAHSVASRKLVV